MVDFSPISCPHRGQKWEKFLQSSVQKGTQQQSQPLENQNIEIFVTIVIRWWDDDESFVAVTHSTAQEAIEKLEYRDFVPTNRSMVDCNGDNINGEEKSIEEPASRNQKSRPQKIESDSAEKNAVCESMLLEPNQTKTGSGDPGTCPSTSLHYSLDLPEINKWVFGFKISYVVSHIVHCLPI